MAMLADFLPWVLPYVSGCSSPLAEQQIRFICIDFCSHAPLVQLTLDPMDAIMGQTEYEIETPTGMETTLIRQAFFRGRALLVSNGRDRTALPQSMPPGEPACLQQQAGNGFELDRPPGQDYLQAIQLRVATKPSRNATTVAEVLLNDYAYPIGLGVVGRLLLMPGQAFSNPPNARTYTEAYLSARTEARIRAEQAFGNAGMQVRPRRFQ